MGLEQAFSSEVPDVASEVANGEVMSFAINTDTGEPSIDSRGSSKVRLESAARNGR
jgi:hypothetical protein